MGCDCWKSHVIRALCTSTDIASIALRAASGNDCVRAGDTEWQSVAMLPIVVAIAASKERVFKCGQRIS